jgi:hypothetical protein
VILPIKGRKIQNTLYFCVFWLKFAILSVSSDAGVICLITLLQLWLHVRSWFVTSIVYFTKSSISLWDPSSKWVFSLLLKSHSEFIEEFILQEPFITWPMLIPSLRLRRRTTTHIVIEQACIKTSGVDISNALKPSLMSLLQQQIIGCCCSIVLICHQAFFGIFGVVPQLAHLRHNVLVERDTLLANQNAFNWWVIKQAIELVSSNLSQSESFVTRCE